jgi:hypothetical protein
MHARVVTYRLDLDRWDEGVAMAQQVSDAARGIPGFVGG